jgi:hypothetical protein
MPGFFFKRLKLDQLGKSRAFSKKALLFPENARFFRLKLRTLVSQFYDVRLFSKLNTERFPWVHRQL